MFPSKKSWPPTESKLSWLRAFLTERGCKILSISFAVAGPLSLTEYLVNKSYRLQKRQISAASTRSPLLRRLLPLISNYSEITCSINRASIYAFSSAKPLPLAFIFAFAFVSIICSAVWLFLVSSCSSLCCCNLDYRLVILFG